jgi:hypothetical protein
MDQPEMRGMGVKRGGKRESEQQSEDMSGGEEED